MSNNNMMTRDNGYLITATPPLLFLIAAGKIIEAFEKFMCKYTTQILSPPFLLLFGFLSYGLNGTLETLFFIFEIIDNVEQ